MTLEPFPLEDQNPDAFFGYTHKPPLDRRGKTLFLNPGSTGEYAQPSYGILMAGPGYLDACTIHLD